MRLGLLLLLGCGDNLPNAETADAAPNGCPASFSGNFTDFSELASNCAKLDTTLTMSITSPLIGSPVAVSLALGAAQVGPYSSETVQTWSAVQARSIGDGACVYSAGDRVVPTGSFTLDLTELAPHGMLTLSLAVHAVDGTECGVGDVEQVSVMF